MIDCKFELYSNGVKTTELPIDKITYGQKYLDYFVGNASITGNNLDLETFNSIRFGAELRVLRKGIGDSDYKYVYQGEIRQVNKSNDPVSSKNISFKLFPVLQVLEDREFTKTYTSEEEEDIVADIVSTVQADTESGNFTAAQSDLDITIGLLQASGNTRSRTYEKDTALKAMQQICKVNDIGGGNTIRGFKVSPTFLDNRDKYLTYNYPLGVNKPNIVFQNDSIMNFTVAENFEYANHIIAYGQGGLRAESYSTNENAKSAYRKRTLIVNASNITTLGALQDYADEQLRIHEQMQTIFSFDIPANNVFTGLYDVGDIINVRYQDDYYDIDTSLTVFEIAVTFDSIGKETVNLKVADNRPVNLDLRIGEKLNTILKDNNQQIKDLTK
jgi:hypothetical protein